MDENLFQEVLRAQKNRIYSYARYFLRHSEDAEDVTQEVFLRVWRSCPEIDGERIAAWMTRVTHNLCIDLSRRRRTAERGVAAAAEAAAAIGAADAARPALAASAARTWGAKARLEQSEAPPPWVSGSAGGFSTGSAGSAMRPASGKPALQALDDTPAAAAPAGLAAGRESARPAGPSSASTSGAWGGDPLARVILGEEQRALLAALQALPGKPRSILLLHYYQGMTHEAIAAQLGIPLNTVKVNAHRGKKVLRRLLSGPDPASLESGRQGGGRRSAAGAGGRRNAAKSRAR